MIVIGDIHGNFDTMIALLDKIPQKEKDKGLVMCGDLIDRGPKSREVVQYVIDNNIDCVMGNHEEMMVDWAEAQKIRPDAQNVMWQGNGGRETLEAYHQITHIDDDGTFWPVPDKQWMKEDFDNHVEWMKKLPYYLEYKDVKNENGQHLLVTHSSASKVWKWSEEHRSQNINTIKQHLTWSRPDTVHAIDGIYNIFGHTPLPYGPRVRTCYANIDTGCFYVAEDEGFGKLTALQFPEMKIYVQRNIDQMGDRWK